MIYEYLLFNAVVFASVGLSAALCPKPYLVYRWHALASIAACALPYLVWDVLVTDRHWWFNHDYVLPLRLFDLPLGEWLFFFTVPLASLFTWEMLFFPSPHRPPPLGHPKLARLSKILGISAGLLGLWALRFGLEYTGLALLALGGSVFADVLAGTRLWQQPRFWILGLLVCVWTTIFNGYLTARPVVLYDPQYQLDFRVITIPIEDYIYGLSLLFYVTIVYEWSKARFVKAPDNKAAAKLASLRAKLAPAAWIEAGVQARLGPYRRLVQGQATPQTLDRPASPSGSAPQVHADTQPCGSNNNAPQVQPFAASSVVSSEPEASSVVSSEPAASNLASTKPAASGVVSSEPAASNLASTEPAASSVVSSEPAASNVVSNKIAANKVAVIGAGLAGMRTASLLAEQGLDVILLEKASYLGGKIGAFEVPGPKGQPFPIEHGFHAFFPHYYNTSHFLKQAGADRHQTRIDDYLILSKDGARYSYQHTHKTPLLNLFSLWRQGHYRLRELVMAPQSLRLWQLLAYHPHKTFARFDQTSYAEFARWAKIPPSLALTFNSFSRAFFAPPEQMSMAELIKSFHFFFLGQDGGLLYDYPNADYESAIIAPMRRYLASLGTKIRLEQEVTSIQEGAPKQGRRFVVEHQNPAGQRAQAAVDHVVLACDVTGVRHIAQRSASLLGKAPTLAKQLSRQRSTHPYCVWRLWLDRAPQAQAQRPVFVITDRHEVLDSVTFYDRFEPHARDWVQSCAHPACVLELHSYCVPSDLHDETACKAALFRDLARYFPSLQNAKILADHFALQQNFPAFFVGEHAHRPPVCTELPGFYVAGDWVRLPHPAMLMEAATMSGVLAANAILQELGLSTAPLWSVPPRGMLAASGGGPLQVDPAGLQG